MEVIWEKAREVGRLLAQSDEYGAFKRANARLSDDRAAVSALNRLNELQETFSRALQGGTEPTEEEAAEYERLVAEVQSSPVYQTFEVARTNFDKVMMRINEEIARGVEAGEKSRIILSS